MLRVPDSAAEPVGIRALARNRRTAGQMSGLIDVSKLLATKTSRIKGNPGKRPILPSSVMGGNA